MSRENLPSPGEHHAHVQDLAFHGKEQNGKSANWSGRKIKKPPFQPPRFTDNHINIRKMLRPQAKLLRRKPSSSS